MAFGRQALSREAGAGPSVVRARSTVCQAAVVTVNGFVAFYRGVQRVGVERATLLTGMIPVAAASTAPFVGNRGFGLSQAAGSVLVAAGAARGRGCSRVRADQPLQSRITRATRAGSSFMGT
ncbi:EamA family transporter [Streptomyces sp. NPDC048577]|uniref:EamA family transporter n=1 Tax=Streptomyces sp. NPDC048577 TaxID=3157209 RepID=UPI0034200DE4